MACFIRQQVHYLTVTLFLLVVGTSVQSQPEVYETRVLTGDPMPGVTPAMQFLGFADVNINQAGELTFWASGIGSVWSEAGGSLQRVAYSDQQIILPSGTARFTSPSLLAGNDAGQTLIESSITGIGIDGTNDFGYWITQDGLLERIVRTGDSAPGTQSGTTFAGLSRGTLNNSGQIVFLGDLTGQGVNATNNRGLWIGNTSDVNLLARTGDEAPGMESDVVFEQIWNTPFGFPPPMVLNDSGQTAFWGLVTGEGVDNTNNAGIWMGSRNDLSLVARSGAAVPDADPEVTFQNFENDMSLNNQGQIAFVGNIAGPGIFDDSNEVLFSGSAGDLSMLIREGDDAPGTDNGVVFRGFDAPVIDNTGNTFFAGRLEGSGIDNTNNFGYWAGSADNIELIVRHGDAAPDIQENVLIEFVNDFIVGDEGQFAFLASLTGSGIDESNSIGLFSADRGGSLSLIARIGDLFDVNHDPEVEDLRTIDFVGLEDISSGGLAFSLGFTDNTNGVFVANPLSSANSMYWGADNQGILDGDFFRATWTDLDGSPIARAPTERDIVNFSEQAQYQVNFSQNANVQRVIVSNGDIKFSLAQHALTITQDLLVENGRLTLMSGELDTGIGVFINDQSELETVGIRVQGPEVAIAGMLVLTNDSDDFTSLSVDGNFRLGDTGVILVAVDHDYIDGSLLGSGEYLLEVSNEAQFAGSVQISVADNYLPSDGDHLRLINAGQLDTEDFFVRRSFLGGFQLVNTGRLISEILYRDSDGIVVPTSDLLGRLDGWSRIVEIGTFLLDPGFLSDSISLEFDWRPLPSGHVSIGVRGEILDSEDLILTEEIIDAVGDGTLVIRDGQLDFFTGSPVTAEISFTAEEIFNTIDIEVENFSGDASLAFIQILLDGDIIDILSVPDFLEASEDAAFALPETVDIGEHVLSITLDTNAADQASLTVTRISTQYVGIIPEPQSLIAFSLGGWALLRRRR